MKAVVNGLLTNYQISGKGKPVLLLHGWGDSLKSMDQLRQDLSESHTVLSVDLPGFGDTQPPDKAWDLDDYSEFIAAFLSKVGIADPYAVIGHSNGGALAIRALAIGKVKTEKLVLLAASGIRTGKSLKRIVLVILAKVGNLATIWMPERYRQALRKSLYDTAGSDLLVVPGMEDTFKKTVKQDVQADAANLNLPTLMIYARNDDAVPLHDGYTYQKIINGSKLEIIENAGHFLHQEAAGQVNKLVEGFLK